MYVRTFGKGCRGGAGGSKNNPDLLTGVLTPVQDQQLTRLWFGKTYTNSRTGAGQEAFNFAKWIRFLFQNCTSEPICRNWLWEALDVGRSTLSGQSHDTPVNATMIGQIAVWLEIAAVTISQ